ncbi:MAG: SGNH/GDSL hydrolase family protein [Elusimicrobiota bacterium]|jgi:lysophospholipase L1-like esterase|nr:SGNH/GDSL hydrolase family protein [Elusimicrobiota bacterium]
MDLIKKIEVLGDSILRGVIFDERLGKYKFIKESAANLFSKTNNMIVNNHSKFGCTTRKALSKLSSILTNRVSGDFVLVELGGNDCDLNWREVCSAPYKDHRPNVEFAEFKRNICAILEQIISAGKRPVIMTLPPIDSDRYFDFIVAGCREKARNLLAFLSDKSRIYRSQEMYATAFEKIALKYNVFVINMREKLLALPRYSDYLCLDGIHLNVSGQNYVKQILDDTYSDYLSSARGV